MLLQKGDLDIMKKYLIPIGDDSYRLKETPISQDDRNKLLALDRYQLVCYGTHLIEDYEKLNKD